MKQIKILKRARANYMHSLENSINTSTRIDLINRINQIDLKIINLTLNQYA
jgi:hypothetical protein